MVCQIPRKVRKAAALNMEIKNQDKLNEIIKKYSCSLSDQSAIYVADYASYNEGFICGAWFDLTNFSDKDEFMQKVDEFFKELDKVAPLDFGRPREEMMFQDWQCINDNYINESWISSQTWEYFDFVNQDEDNEKKLDAYLNFFASSTVTDFADIVSDMEERFFMYLDSHNFDEDFGYALIHEHGFLEIPEQIERYFDYAAYGSDCSHDYAVHNGYVFMNN